MSQSKLEAFTSQQSQSLEVDKFCTMNIDPLCIPEILSKVLEHADMNTLKASRLVSSFWNAQAGRFLPSSSWITLFNDKKRSTKPADLNRTLETSADPSKFFGKLVMDEFLPWKDEVGCTELFEKFGKYLNSLDCKLRKDSSSALSLNFNVQAKELLVYLALSEWCPLLQELLLATDQIKYFEWPNSNVFEFKAPLNLRIIKLFVVGKITERLQDFLIKIVAASRKLKILGISVDSDDHNDRLYRKLFALQDMTTNLSEFEWIGSDDQDQTLLSTIQFSNQLQALRLHSYLEDPTSFPFVTNSIGNSLKTLELMHYSDYDVDDDDERAKETQSHLFQMVMKTLLNLETLRLGYQFCHHDHFFNADNLNAPPHLNLRRLVLPWCVDYNLLEVSSVRNVVKWFPNLTLLSLCFGKDKTDLKTMGIGIRLQEAVGIVSGLKRLKDLSLRVCSNTSPGDLQLALKELNNFPCLQRCTFVEFGNELDHFKREIVKTTYAVEDLEDYMNGLQHLTFIRLMGFKITGTETILNFAKENGIKLEIYNERPCSWNFTWEITVGG